MTTKELTAYSVVPFISKSKEPPPEKEDFPAKVARRFFYSFKNGEGFKGESFEKLVTKIVARARCCPVFRNDKGPVVVSRIPSSGQPKKAQIEDPVKNPIEKLCLALSKNGVADKYMDILQRTEKTPKSSESNRDVDRQRRTIEVAFLSALSDNAKLVLVDDLVTTGTTFMGASLSLENAGWKGPLECFAVAHTVSPSTKPIEFQDCVEHSITWWDADKSDRASIRNLGRPDNWNLPDDLK